MNLNVSIILWIFFNGVLTVLVIKKVALCFKISRVFESDKIKCIIIKNYSMLDLVTYQMFDWVTEPDLYLKMKSKKWSGHVVS